MASAGACGSLNCIDLDRRTPLMLAVIAERADVVRVILGRDDAGINARDFSGKAALHHAVTLKDSSITEMLLAYNGIDVNRPDRSGRTPLHTANGSRVMRLLFAHSDVDVCRLNRNGSSALLYAAEKGYEDVVQAPLERGAPPGVTDDWGHTPLSEAAKAGHDGVVKLLEVVLEF
ncbi:ankyrin repeat-containing domain protein [Aspergillus pseudoustus]|uniref:Ankyrin repeat-containing domain protein n=1 Tax=Aspergillus pseudoustus TaxID=1810923 RepID=A0ABR4JEJ4_9EURO